MADSYSPFLAVTLPATGAYNNTWGAVLNANTLSLLDVAICGWTSETVTGTSFSLPALSNGAASDSRYFSLLFAGTPSDTVTVTVPSSVKGKMYLINNQTGQDLTFTYSGSTETVTVANGLIQLIWCDGTDCYAVNASASDSPSLGGVPAANWVQGQYTTDQTDADTVVQNRISIPTAWPWYAQAPVVDNLTFDCHNGNAQQATLTGDWTVAAPSNPVDGSELLLLLIQDGTGGRTLSWNSVFWFENGTAPVLASIAGGLDVIWCRYNSGLNKWVCAHFANLNAGGGTSSGITISANCQDFNLSAVIGSMSASQTINITIEKGVIIEASGTGVAAMDLGNIISGSTINIVNNGYVMGHGGDGAQGPVGVGGVSFGFVEPPRNGFAGGNAINGPGSGVTLNINNSAGYIWGGGGGGGAPGVNASSAAGAILAGGGGGGGAGNGRGGRGRSIGDYTAGTTAGVDGGDGNMSPVNTAYGAAGASGTKGSMHVGTGGAGGDWGTAGSDGTAAATGYGHTYTEGTGGAAGSAIALNGGSVSTFTGSTTPHVKGAVA